MGVVRTAIRSALERAPCSTFAQADVILTTGGVSVGDADYVRELIALW